MDNQTSDNTTPSAQSKPITSVAQKTSINKLGLWSFLLVIAFIPVVYVIAFIIGVIIGASILSGDIKLASNSDAIYGFAAPIYALMYAQFLILPTLVTSLVLGIASFSKKGAKNGLGIAGVCLSSLGVLVSIFLIILGVWFS